MKLTEKQIQHINAGQDVGVSDNSYAASNYAFHRWPNAIIPYVIDCSLANMPTALEAIRLAQEEWMNKTCIKFVKKKREKYYLRFFRDTHCWGHVGRGGARTSISVGRGCEAQHVMVHEIGHAVGFFHEQNRMDRDDWVDIFWDNIYESMKSAFRKVVDTDSLGIHYDYASIMHYPWDAFSMNRSDTMRPKRPVAIQPYQHLSDLDAKQTSLMYNCPAILKQREQELNTKLSYTDSNAASYSNAASGNVSVCTNIQKQRTCDRWAKAGWCEKNTRVRETCKKSCNFPECDPTIACTDHEDYCAIEVSSGHCRSMAKVAKHCLWSCAARCVGLPPVPRETQVSLGRGILCIDKKNYCARRAAGGECHKSFMIRYCRKSCNQTDCDAGIQKPTGSCADPLGLAWNGKEFKLPDSAFNSSSHFSHAASGWVASAANARLYYEDDYDNKRIGAWCVGASKNNDKGTYVQVDLKQQKTVQYIATQGRDKYFERVRKFKIGYGNNGVDFKFYQENGQDKVFLGNCDHFTPILNRFKNPINARYLRFYPIEANYKCMRMEFYGC